MQHRGGSSTHEENARGKKMSEIDPPGDDLHKPEIFEIRIKGHLDDRWKSWFEGLTLALEDNGNTLLTGMVADQAALHGLLKKVWNLGMPLISVNSVKPSQSGEEDINK
jgi:hypothetical protein